MNKKLIILLLIVSLLAIIVACDPVPKEPKATKAPTAGPSAEPTEEPTPTVEPTPTPKPEPGTNVAMGKPYDVSSETDFNYVQWGWSADFINDGRVDHEPDDHAGWTSAVKQYMDLEDFDEEWVMIDLKGPVEIDKIVLWPRQDNGRHFPEDYHITISLDGKEHTTIVEISGDMRSVDDYTSKPPAILTFEPVEARYVTLVVTKPSSGAVAGDGYLVQLAEFEIFAAPSIDTTTEE